jgi:predicted TIM-barrel fold metal-dependent hydrolase
MLCCPESLVGLHRSPAAVSAQAAPAVDAAPFQAPLQWIDVHCHVFNAADLPVAEFIEHTRLQGIGRVLAYPVLALIASIYQLAPISARDELDQLGTSAPRPGAPAPLTKLQALYALHGATPPGGAPATPSPLRPLNNGDRLLSDALKEVDPTRAPEQPLTDADHAVLAEKLTQDDADADINEDLLGWAGKLAQPRNTIVGDLLAQFPAGANVMLTPALVDYNRWLGIDADDDSAITSLDGQVQVMAAVARSRVSEQPATVMTSFAPFDPWRSIEDDTVLPRLRNWLEQGLAVGVKLYPPMGFAAAGNGGANMPDPPQALKDLVANRRPGMDTGAALDAELDRLFTLCTELDAPVMAHCASSELAEPENASLPSPDYWRLALDKHPTLRLNLGHFGGVWHFAADDTDADTPQAVQIAQDWATSITQLMRDFPNVYADFAYFDLALVEPVNEGSPTALALQFIARLADDNPVLVQRLMYGSDWIMVGILAAADDYARRVTRALDLMFRDDAAQENLLWRNAARFLGLAQGNKTRARLEGFLGAQANLLTRFDPGPG